MAIGLPGVLIDFKTKGTSAIERSARGIVALILKDGATAKSTTVKSVDEVSALGLTATNAKYLNMALAGGPNKVLVEIIPTTDADYSNALALLKNKKWNYLSVPGASEGEVATLVTWVKGCRDTDKKTFKYVAAKSAADCEGVINFATEDVETADGTFSAIEYTARIAGVLAGLSLDRSATYYRLSDIVSITESATPDADINAGKLILINDGGGFKIARGVNSLTTFTADKGEDFRKIKIVEGVDMVRDDIRDTFENYYAGKVINSYDNKRLLIAAINVYFKTLAGNVLDSSFDNNADIDFAAQKLYAQGKGEAVDDMAEMDILTYNTGANVYISSNVKFVDAMEDLKMNVYM